MKSSQRVFAFVCFLLVADHAKIFAQTTVTTPGATANTVPVFTDVATVGSSGITVNPANGNIGIGVASPNFKLDLGGDLNLNGGMLRYNGLPLFTVPSIGSYFLGNTANTSNTGGSDLAFGDGALANNTTGYGNIAIGDYTLNANTSSSSNTAVGDRSLQQNTSGVYNASYGAFSLQGNTTGSLNNAFGTSALISNLTGSYNTAMGHNSLSSATTSDFNTAFGVSSLISETGGQSNVAIGANALTGLEYGVDNTAIGDGAGDDAGGVPNAFSRQNIYVGASSNGLQNGDDNEIVIGAYTQGHGSNTVTLGNNSIQSTTLVGKIILTPGQGNGSIQFPDGTIQTTAANGSGGNSGASSGIITQSGTNISIGTSGASSNITVNGILQVTGNSNPVVATQGAYLGWNALNGGGVGETDFINNQGAGTGGFAFLNTTTEPGTPLTALAVMTGSGNLGVGTTTPSEKLELNGNLRITQNSGAHIIFSDQTVQQTAWNGTTLGGDYAEAVDVAGDRAQFEPGDLIAIDPASPGHFLKAQGPYSTMIAGVYSTKPGLIGRRTTSARINKQAEVPMAMMGIVPVKVTAENGLICVGDLLVSSSKPGYAMRGTDRNRLIGAVIGKALAPITNGSGLIEVLITLQ